MYKRFKNIIYKFLIPVIKVYKHIMWLVYLRTHNEINLVVGGGESKFKDWFSTDISTLDITKDTDFKKYFTGKKINRILAEHVLEHLTIDDLNKMLKNFEMYSLGTVNIRIAVPDGFHADNNYIESVKPGGTGAGSHDHKNLFNYKSLTELFAGYGFKAHLLEYWDENNNFFTIYKNDNKGFISRSFINDDRNGNGTPNYTSLIIDFTKE